MLNRCLGVEEKKCDPFHPICISVFLSVSHRHLFCLCVFLRTARSLSHSRVSSCVFWLTGSFSTALLFESFHWLGHWPLCFFPPSSVSSTTLSMLYSWCDTRSCCSFTNSSPHIDPPIWPKDLELWFISPKDFISLFYCPVFMHLGSLEPSDIALLS